MRAIVSSVTCYGLRTCMSRYAVTEREGNRAAVDRALLGCIDPRPRSAAALFRYRSMRRFRKEGKKVFQNEFFLFLGRG